MRRKSLSQILAIFCFILLLQEAYGHPGKLAMNVAICNAPMIQQETGEKSYFVLPFHLIDGFILIDATINGKEGKLMFDTGTPFSFFLNNNKLNLDKNKKIAEGQAASGQEIVLYKSDPPLSIEFDYRQKTVTEQGTIHANFEFVEKGITPAFLGFIGYGFFKDYEFMIDYDNQVIEFFLIDETGELIDEHKKERENVEGIIRFKKDTGPNVPVAQLQIGPTRIPAYFDTGDQSSITLTPDTKEDLVEGDFIEENEYSAWYGEYFDEKNTFNLKESTVQGIPIRKVKNLDIDQGGNAATLGYQFLKLYKTVWNFKRQTITLLKR